MRRGADGREDPDVAHNWQVLQCLTLVVLIFGLTLPLVATSGDTYLGATGFDVGGETPGACGVVGNSLNCLQTYSCKRRQLRSGGLIPPNLRLVCACASRFGGRAHKLAGSVCSRPTR